MTQKNNNVLKGKSVIIYSHLVSNHSLLFHACLLSSLQLKRRLSSTGRVFHGYVSVCGSDHLSDPWYDPSRSLERSQVHVHAQGKKVLLVVCFFIDCSERSLVVECALNTRVFSWSSWQTLKHGSTLPLRSSSLWVWASAL